MAFSEYQKQVVDGLGNVVKNTKSLGTIKTPSKSNKNSEVQEESLSYLAATSGLISALLVGPTAAKSVFSDPNNANNVISKLSGKNLFSSIDNLKNTVKQEVSSVNTVLKDIKKSIEGINDVTGTNIVQALSNISAGIQNLVNISASNDGGQTKEISIDLSSIDNLKNTVKQEVSSVNTVLKDIKKSIEGLNDVTSYSITSTLSDISTQLRNNKEEQSNTPSSIIEIDFKNIDGGIKNLEQFVEGISGKPKSLLDFAKGFSEALKALASVKVLTSDSVNKTIVKNIVSITQTLEKLSKNPAFVEALKKISKNFSDIDLKPLTNIDKLFDAIESISKVGVIKTLKFKIGVKMISKHIITSLEDFYDTLANVKIDSKKAKQVNGIVFDAQKVVDMCLAISNLGFFKSLVIRMKMGVISKNIAEALIDFNEAMNDVNNGVDSKKVKSTFESIKFVKDIIDVLKTNLDIDTFLVRDNIDQLVDLIQNVKRPSLATLFESLNTLSNKKVKDPVDVLNTIETLNSIFDKIPGFVKILLAEAKIESLNKVLIDQLNVFINKVNDMPKFTKRSSGLATLDALLIQLATAFDTMPGLKTIGGVVAKVLALTSLTENLNQLVAKINLIEKTNKKAEYWQELTSIIDKMYFTIYALQKFSDLKLEDTQYAINIVSGLGAFNTIVNSLPEIAYDEEFYQEQATKLITIKPLIECLGELFDTIRKVENIDSVKLDLDEITNFLLDLTEDSLLGTHIEEIINIKNSDLEKMVKIGVFVDNVIDVTSKMSKLDKLADHIKDPKNSGLVKFMEVIKNTCDKLNEIVIDEKQVDKIKELSKSLLLIVGGCAAVLILAGLALTVVSIADVILFAVTLGVFVKTLVTIFTSNSKAISEGLAVSGEFGRLVLYSAFTLILGGMAMSLINIADILLFGAIELAFIGGLVGIHALFADKIKQSIEISEGFSKLVLLSAGVLILGGMAMNFINPGQLLTFVAVELAFMVGLIGVYALASTLGLDEAISTGKDFAILVAVSGLTLAIGSLITQFVSFGDLFSFALNLGLFMMMIMAPLLLFKGVVGLAQGTAKEFAFIVLTAGSILIIGALVFKYIPDLAEKSILFAIVFGVFLGLISLSLLVLSKAFNSKKTWLNLIVFAACVGFMTALLFYSASFIGENPDTIKNAFIFLGVFAAFVLGTGLIVFILGKLWTHILIGAAVTLAIIGLNILVMWTLRQINDFSNEIEWGSLLNAIAKFGVGLLLVGAIYAGFGFLATFVIVFLPVAMLYILGMALINGLAIQVLKEVNDFSSMVNWDTLLNGIAKFAVGLLAMGAAYAAFGAEALVFSPFIAISLAAVLGISEVTQNAVLAFKTIADNQQYFDKRNVEKFVGAIDALETIGVALIDKFGSLKMLIKLKAVLGTVNKLAEVIGSISESIANYASLIIPVFDDEGKLSGFRTLTDQDFTSAATNITTIIETVGGAIMDAYERNPEMFETNIFGNSPFGKTVRALKNMGSLISDISKSVKDYATLQIPIYDKTDIVGYRPLNAQDFKDAAENIKTVIEILGKAIIDVYEAHPDMFDSNLFGNTPFGKTVRALKNMGSMISDISKSVKDYASFQIPIYTGKDITGYRPLNKDDFKNVSENIKTVIEVLGNAIIDVYKAHPDMFDSNLFGNTPFGKTVRALQGMGGMIADISAAVKDYASFQIPIYKNGEIVDYRPLDQKDFDAVGTNMSKLIRVLGESVANLYDQYPEMFKEGLFENSKFAIVCSALKDMGAMIGGIAQGVKTYSEGTIPVYDKNGKEIDRVAPNYQKVAENISLIMTALGRSVMDTFGQYPNLFDESNGILGIGAKKSKFQQMVEGITGLSGTIGTIAQAVVDIASMKIPTKFNEKGEGIEWVIVDANRVKTQIGPVVSSIFTALVNPLKQLMDNKDIMNLLEKLTKGDEPALNYLSTGNQLIAQALSSVAKDVTNIAKINLPDPKVLAKLKVDLLTTLILVKRIADVIMKGDIGLDVATFLGADKKTQALSSFTDKLLDFNYVLKKLNETIDESKQIGTEGYDNVSNGIENIYEKTNNIGDNGNFKQHTQVLDKYVSTINRINTDKIDRLTRLTNAMNILATKMGNVDKFTEVLAENISQVLDKLTKELKISRETIEKADKLQIRRHKLISESVKSVKKIMDDPLRVEIRKVDDTDDIPSNRTQNPGMIPPIEDNKQTTTSSGTGGSPSLSDAGGTSGAAAQSTSAKQSSVSSNSGKQNKQQNIPSNANAEAKYNSLLNDILNRVTSNGRMLSSIDDKLVHKGGISKSAST